VVLKVVKLVHCPLLIPFALAVTDTSSLPPLACDSINLSPPSVHIGACCLTRCCLLSYSTDSSSYAIVHPHYRLQLFLGLGPCPCVTTHSMVAPIPQRLSSNPEILGATSIGQVHKPCVSAVLALLPAVLDSLSHWGVLWLPVSIFLSLLYAPICVVLAGISLCWPSSNEKDNGCRQALNKSEMFLLLPAHSVQQIISPDRWEDNLLNDDNLRGTQQLGQATAV